VFEKRLLLKKELHELYEVEKVSSSWTIADDGDGVHI
jgi:hypothetical protein